MQILTKLAAVLVLIASYFSTTEQSYADGLSFLLSPRARYFFTQTQPGVKSIRSVIGSDIRGSIKVAEYDQFLGHLASRPQESAEVSQLWTEVESILNKSNVPFKIGEVQESAEFLNQKDWASRYLSTKERAALSELAGRKLVLNPKWKASVQVKFGDPVSEFDFIDSSKLQNATPLFEKTLYEAPFTTFRTQDAMAAPSGFLRNAMRETNEWFSSIKQCLKNTPDARSAQENRRYLLESLLITEANTVIGTVLGVGEKKINAKELASDMLLAGMSSVIAHQLLFDGDSYLVKWIRVAGWSEFWGLVQGTYYYMTPLKDTQGLDVKQAAIDRTAFNLVWGASIGPTVSLSMFAITKGLRCLYPNAIVQNTLSGLRIAQNAGTSTMYFHLRHNYQEDKLKEAGLK